MKDEIRFGRSKIQRLLTRLSDLLAREHIRGEILLFGGAAMVLGWNARGATRDIDAVFEPPSKIRRLARQIASEEHLPDSWLNDAVKGFIDIAPEKSSLNKCAFSSDHLQIYTPPPEYLIAMKSLSARTEPEFEDVNDLKFLIKKARLKSLAAVFKIVLKYYPKRPIPAKTTFFVESVFDSIKTKRK